MRFGVGELIIIFFLLVLTALQIVASWKIVSKAGYSGALSLLVLVPIVNIVMFFVFAFSEWPVQREVRVLKTTPAPVPPEAYKRG